MDFTEELIRRRHLHRQRRAHLSRARAGPVQALRPPDHLRSPRTRPAQAQLDDAAFVRAERRNWAPTPGRGAAARRLAAGAVRGNRRSQALEPDLHHRLPGRGFAARASDAREGITERFELFMTGREIANGFSELNDPEDRRALPCAGRSQDAGDEEAMYYDADYIRAGIRHAPDRRLRHRHRPSDHAADRQPQHPRRDPVPAPARTEAGNRAMFFKIRVLLAVAAGLVTLIRQPRRGQAAGVSRRRRAASRPSWRCASAPRCRCWLR